jgi:hypothetical protein
MVPPVPSMTMRPAGLCNFLFLDKNTVLDEDPAPSAQRTQRPPVQDRPKLTARQQQIFDLVRQAIERTGAPPRAPKIAAQLGFKSANAAEEHLQALARKGMLELVGGTSRGIRLKSDTLRVNRARQFACPSAWPS